MSERLNAFVKKNDSLDETIYIGRLEHLNIWDEYGLLDDVHLLPKYLFLDDDNSDLFIIELPSEKHDYMAQEIILQLELQCQYVAIIWRLINAFVLTSVQLPLGVSVAALSTKVIEVGLSQKVHW